MKINISLALASAVFLMAWAISFVSNLFRFTSIKAAYPLISSLLASGLLFIVIIELLGIISFFGSVLFLMEARKKLSRWYLAAPMCILLSLLVMTNILVYFNGKPFLDEPISTAETLWTAVMALLAPCSVLFFLSSYGHDSSTKIYVAVSSGASVFSVVFLSLALLEIYNSSSIEAVFLPLALYWTVLMPAIGVCLLSNATMYTENNNVEEES